MLVSIFILIIEAVKIYKVRFPDKQYPALVYTVTNNIFIWYMLAAVLPFFCLLLLVVLIENKPPKSQRVSILVLLFGVMCPAALLWLATIGPFVDYYYPMEKAGTVWILITIIPLNILLFGNLRQYAKAIRQAEEQETS